MDLATSVKGRLMGEHRSAEVAPEVGEIARLHDNQDNDNEEGWRSAIGFAEVNEDESVRFECKATDGEFEPC